MTYGLSVSASSSGALLISFRTVEGGQGQSRRAGSRVLRNHPAVEPPKLNRTPKANDRKRKQSTARSVLSPIDPAKVSKAPSKKRSFRRKMSARCDASQVTEKMITDSSTPESRTKQAFKAKDTVSASLHPIHLSRISKPDAKRSTRRHRSSINLTQTSIHQRTKKNNSDTPPNSSTDRKVTRQSINASLRKSTRTTKRPERFHPGYQ